MGTVARMRYIGHMRYAQVMRQLTRGQNLFALHAAGCSDLTREIRDHQGLVEEFDADTLDEAKRTVIDDTMVDDMGYDRERDLTVYPCCTGGLKARKPLAPDTCTGTGQPLVGPSNRLYLPCPVCGKYVKALGRIDTPRHKAAK